MKKLAELTPEEKRIIVAEFENSKVSKVQKLENGRWFALIEGAWVEIPDYLNDPKAIVKAIQNLHVSQQPVFDMRLEDVLGIFVGCEGGPSLYQIITTATPEKLTDALILTIGAATL